MTAPANRPWLALRYVSKVEIVPGPGSEGVFVRLEEEAEYDNPWYEGGARVVLRERKLALTNETIRFQYEYPDDFKKLVAVCNGQYAQAYEIYQALQKKVPADWDKEPEEEWDDCECC